MRSIARFRPGLFHFELFLVCENELADAGEFFCLSRSSVESQAISLSALDDDSAGCASEPEPTLELGCTANRVARGS